MKISNNKWKQFFKQQQKQIKVVAKANNKIFDEDIR